jgi:hypothetical protein
VYAFDLAGAEPRLARRYKLLVMSHLSSANMLAAGMRIPPALSLPFAATQAAWRFYANPEVSLKMLMGPLVELARREAARWSDGLVLVALDWSNLHFEGHASKADRTRLSRGNNQGYKMLSALAIGPEQGEPVAPLCVDMLSGTGVHSSRSGSVVVRESTLDWLTSMMRHVGQLELGKTPVFIVDAEADSVAHYRQWQQDGRLFVVRGDAGRKVEYQGEELLLGAVADTLKGSLKAGIELVHKGRRLRQFIGEAQVILRRPARRHRVVAGQKRHENIPGQPLSLRVVISELRDEKGQRVARWLLLTNVPATRAAGLVAKWYLWRWRIEDCHKQLKTAGQQVESWQQESAPALAKRLCVALMSLALVWRVARDSSSEGEALRGTLVRLSGRQIMRGKDHPGFTESALLAGLGVLMPMLALLQEQSITDLRALVERLLPGILPGSDKPG